MSSEIGINSRGKIPGQPLSRTRNGNRRIETLQNVAAAGRQCSIGNNCESFWPPHVFQKRANGSNLLWQRALAGIGEHAERDLGAFGNTAARDRWQEGAINRSHHISFGPGQVIAVIWHRSSLHEGRPHRVESSQLWAAKSCGASASVASASQ